LARFHNEVRISRQITHTNVCRVYDIGECDGMHFLSMEFVRGEDLATLLRRIGKLPHEKAVEMARQLASGLAAAHEAGVIHQDLKPGNVLIDSHGRVRITDFGVAEVASRARDSMVIVGTPAYMSPEQLVGRGTSVQSDIYSLGLVLYEIFTGKPLHEKSGTADRTRVHDQTGTQIAAPAMENLEPAIERVIARCIERRSPAKADLGASGAGGTSGRRSAGGGGGVGKYPVSRDGRRRGRSWSDFATRRRAATGHDADRHGPAGPS